MEKDIQNRIKDWLSKQGYPLEMKVAEIFQKNDFYVNLSSYYEDPRENIYREIDVLAMDGICNIHKTAFDVKFIIECKYSPNKPWLLFNSNSDIETKKKYDITRRYGSKYGEIALYEISGNKKAQENILFSFSKQISYGITRAFENSSDMTFKAVTSVLKATKYFVNQFDSINDDTFVGYIAIAFPIIVIDGPLFNCLLNKDNEVEITETDMGYLLVRNEEYNIACDSIITIVTLKTLSEYVDKLNTACKELKTILLENTPNLHNMIKKKTST